MEGTNTENIPKAAVQPTDPISHISTDDREQPSVSTQPTLNQSTVERTPTNTYALELPVLLLFFSWNLSGTVFQNQVLFQSCILKYNESTCNLLTNEDIPTDLEVTFHGFSYFHCCLPIFFHVTFYLETRSGNRGICIEDIYGTCCFGKYHSGIHKFFYRPMVG